MLFQQPEGDLRRFLHEAGRQGAGEPLLEETDTAQAALITEFPMAQQIRLCGEGQADLEIPQDVLENPARSLRYRRGSAQSECGGCGGSTAR